MAVKPKKVTIEDIKARCFIDDDGCWIWRGGQSRGFPRIFAPNHQKPGSPKEAQPGRRAAWHVATGKPIPDGHRVYGTCMKPLCVNPACAKCGTGQDVGDFTVATGRYRNQARRIAASRLTGRKRSSVSAALVAEIQSSNETGRAIARRLQVGRGVAYRARRGELLAFVPIGSVFGGLCR